MAEFFPMTEPYDRGMLDVGDGNRLYWETCGNPNGKPAVMLHGGPGQGCTPDMRRMFDPERYRAVLFDQRGCGRSTPHTSDPATSMAHNRTQHLIADLERLRQHLGIDRWVVVGGSWGSTLGVAYTVRYPERVSGVMLSSITLSTPGEIDWLYRGIRRFFPEEWQRLRAVPGVDADLPAAFSELMETGDTAVRNRAATAWQRWEDVVLSLEPGAKPVLDRDPPDRHVLAFVRTTAFYYANAGFLGETELLDGVRCLAGIPAVLIHGRLDLSCPVITARQLAEAWPGCELLIDDHSGHRGSALKREWTVNALARFTDH